MSIDKCGFNTSSKRADYRVAASLLCCWSRNWHEVFLVNNGFVLEFIDSMPIESLLAIALHCFIN